MTNHKLESLEFGEGRFGPRLLYSKLFNGFLDIFT